MSIGSDISSLRIIWNMTDPRATTDAFRQRIAALSPERRALLEQHLQQQGLSLEEPALAEPALTAQVRPPVSPLSPAQQNLWALHQLNPESSAYHIAMSWRLTGRLDIPALEHSLNVIAQRHESLRTIFIEQNGQPFQKVLPEVPSSFWSAADLRLLPETAMQAEVQRLTAQSVRQPFDLSQGPLFRCRLLRLDETASVLLLTLHHIVADGWSRGVLMRELAILYGDFCAGKPVSLSPLPIQYADYALWQQQWLQSNACQIQLDYWRKQLASLPVLELPGDYPRPVIPSFASRTCTHTLSPDRVSALKALGRQQGTTLFMTLLAVFKLLLHRYSAQEDIGVGVPVANRHHSEVELLIGFFVNTLVLRTRLVGTMTFHDLLQQVKQTAAKAFQYQEVPFAKVFEALQPERDLSQNPLFQVMFQLQSGYHLQNAADPDLDLPGLTLRQTWVDPGHTKFDMTWHGIERDNGLLLAVEYRTDLFNDSRIQRMLRHFQTLLDDILANPNRSLAELSLLSPVERHQLLVDWNRTEAPLPAHCFHQRFETQVDKTPDEIAVTDPYKKLTYHQLDHRANQLAHTLRTQGIGPEALVGVCLPRSVDLMVALLGVLKAGGAYVPLDPSLSLERLRFILDDAQASLLIAADLEMMEAVGSAYPILDVGDWEAIAQAPGDRPTVKLDPDNLAYVIYTSGSTGRPKGALLTHRGLSNYLSWCAQAYDVAAGDGIPVQSSIGFDATITSLFAPLLTGRSVALLPEPDDIEALSEALQKGDRYSLVKLTPSHLRALAPLLSARLDRSVSLRSDIPSPPHSFIIGGEALQARDIAFWRQKFPKTQLINEYGPTEAVVGCCIYDIPLDVDGDAIPIGRPIANVQLYILDSYLEPVPVGVPGELYIGGAGVARGYLNRPDLTAERFVPNPFLKGKGKRERGKGNSKPSLPLAPCSLPLALYKTGDRARYRPDGTLEYLGRIDDQIKLRGYRIEPGEIEAVLCQHPEVEQAVVMLRNDVGQAAKLVAYVVLKAEGRKQKAEGREQEYRRDGVLELGSNGVTPSSPPPSPTSYLSTLLPHLRAHLPAYMVPDHFVVLEALPLTVNGKMDRQALPTPATKDASTGNGNEPRTEAEQQLVAIWAEVLRRDGIGIYDNFFELGGDSILGMQIVAKAHQSGLRLTPRQLFQNHTVAELAAVAEVRSPTPISQDVVTWAAPLTPIQRDFFAQELPEPNHFNQAVMVSVATDVQPQILEQALQQLALHHDELRSRFFQQDNEWRQVIQAPEEVAVPLDNIDFSNVPTDFQATAFETAVNRLQASLNLANGLLFKAALLHLGEKSANRSSALEGHRLLLIAHHLIVDGVSWRILLEDLETAYHRLAASNGEQGERAILPPKTSSFQSWAHQLVNLAQAGMFDAERSYWREVCAAVASPLPVDFEGGAGTNTVVSLDEIATVLDADQTQKLLKGDPQGFNAQVNEILLTALGQTLKSWTQSSTVLIDLEGHGRQLPLQDLQDLQISIDGMVASDIDVSRTVGWFTAIYPLQLTVPNGTIADQLKSVKEQLRSVPNRGIGHGILRYLAPFPDPALISPAEISFNYLGQISLGQSSLDQAHAEEPQRFIQALAAEPVGLLRSPLGKRRYLLDVIALIRGGHLQIIWRYSRQVHRRATIEAISQRYVATLRSHIAYFTQPSIEETYTPSDFAAARVSQAQLDQLLSKIRGG